MKQIAISLLSLISCLLLLAQEGKKNDPAPGFRPDGAPPPLESRFQEWLDMVGVVAGSEELRAFRELPTAGDRDAFIRLFWQQRDPTPGTEANEYRAEIEKRFRHVNQFFGRGTPRPGWMTAMGRIYMILGEPNSTESFDNVAEVYPVQVWYYYGDAKLGLPAYFNVTFYKPQGTGEWVLYDPASDGPTSLLVNGDRFASSDYGQIRQLLQNKAPTLAGPAFSMVPGQPFDGNAPSLRSAQIMANIYRSPIRSVNSAYAANFLKYKAYVSVDSSTRYIENSHVLTVVKDDLWGFNIVTFSIKPKKLSFDFSGPDDRYTLAFDLTATLRQGDRETFSLRRHYELAVAPSQMDILRSGGVVIHESFPALPGDYLLTVFMQNPLSKEFGMFEAKVSIPATARPRLAPPLAGFKAETLAGNFYCAYKAGGRRLAVDPDQVFAAARMPLLWLGAANLDRSLWEKGRFEWEIKGLNENRPFRQVNARPLAASLFQRNLNAIEKASPGPLPPDFYTLTLRLIDGEGRVIDSRETNFQVSPLASLAQPSEMYSQLPVDSPYYFDFLIAQQLRGRGEPEKAAYGFEKSLQAKPDFSDARQALLEILLSQGKFERVLHEAEQLPGEGTAAFAGHYLRGQAQFGLGNFQAALAELLAASRIINTDANLLNLIGRSCLQLGDREQAAQAFAASLALNENQPEIEKLLAEAEAKTHDKGK